MKKKINALMRIKEGEMKSRHSKKVIGYILVCLSLLIAFFFAININLIIPAGFILGINGIVISRNIMIIFVLYSLARLGYHFIESR